MQIEKSNEKALVIAVVMAVGAAGFLFVYFVMLS
jgi:hypothetical protein